MILGLLNLADLVFTFLFAEITRRIKQHFHEHEIVTAIPWCAQWLCSEERQPHHATGSAFPVDVTWMDDMSILLQADNSACLLQRLKLAATMTVDECLKAVLLPNLRAGKTEAVVSLVGKGSLSTSRTAMPVFD